jgi:hypothetical protein
VSVVRTLALFAAVAVAATATDLGRALAAAPPRVTVIGDSVASALTSLPDAVDQLGAGIDLRLELAVCRRLVDISCPYQGSRPPTALDLVRDDSRPLGPIVVIDVGYNEFLSSFPDSVNTIMQALVKAGVEHVLWVTLTEERASYATMNSQVRDAAKQWSQITVVDWNQASAGKPWFGDDGLHLNADGAHGLAVLLRTAIVDVCGQDCVPPPPPPTRLRVAIPVLSAVPTLSLDLPAGWSLAEGRWRRWSGMQAGWTGPTASGGGTLPGTWRAGALLRPPDTGLAAVRQEILSAPASLEGRKSGVRVVGERFIRAHIGRAWQLETRGATVAGQVVFRWTFVTAGEVRVGSGGTRTLIYAFRTSCDQGRCLGATTIVRSVATH